MELEEYSLEELQFMVDRFIIVDYLFFGVVGKFTEFLVKCLHLYIDVDILICDAL